MEERTRHTHMEEDMQVRTKSWVGRRNGGILTSHLIVIKGFVTDILPALCLRVYGFLSQLFWCHLFDIVTPLVTSLLCCLALLAPICFCSFEAIPCPNASTGAEDPNPNGESDYRRCLHQSDSIPDHMCRNTKLIERVVTQVLAWWLTYKKLRIGWDVRSDPFDTL